MATSTAVAQSDTTRALPTVLIEAALPTQADFGQVQYMADTLLKHQRSAQRLADVLRTEGLANIRSYGSGLTSTTGLRGGAANQTALVFNGFKMPSPLSGLTDFSLLPAVFFDQVRVLPGVQSAVWGSGASGGVVSVSTGAETENSLKIQQNVGSFGALQTSGRLHLQPSGRFGSTTSMARHSANQDFRYILQPSGIEQQQSHAALRQTDLLQEFRWSMPKHSMELRSFTWINNASRQIPPTLAQTSSVAEQGDRGVRSGLEAKWQGSRAVWYGRAGWFREQIKYDDSLTLTRSVVRFDALMAELESHISLHRKHLLRSGVLANYTFGRAPGYTAGLRQQRTIGYTTWAAHWRKRLQTQANLRLDKLLIPSASAQLHATKWLLLRGAAGRTFREPALNELYWLPGGNRLLRPERGWNTELGADLRNGNWVLRATAYQRSTNGQIMWAPVAGSFIWSPANLGLVRTRGMELRLNGAIQLPKAWTVRLQAGHDLIGAINQKAVTLPRIEAGTQLWFVPRNQGFAGLFVQKSGIMLHFQRNYTGQITTPNAALQSVPLDLLSLAYAHTTGRCHWSAFARIENIGNRQWVSINNRPMPGRAWTLGCTGEFIRRPLALYRRIHSPTTRAASTSVASP